MHVLITSLMSGTLPWSASQKVRGSEDRQPGRVETSEDLGLEHIVTSDEHHTTQAVADVTDLPGSEQEASVGDSLTRGFDRLSSCLDVVNKTLAASVSSVFEGHAALVCTASTYSYVTVCLKYQQHTLKIRQHGLSLESSATLGRKVRLKSWAISVAHIIPAHLLLLEI
jgi:hypothetical protein